MGKIYQKEFERATRKAAIENRKAEHTAHIAEIVFKDMGFKNVRVQFKTKQNPKRKEFGAYYE